MTFAVSSGPATISSGNILSFTGAGEVTITASQAGNDNYLEATQVSRTFSVSKAAASITVTNLSQTYDGTPKPVTTTTDPVGLNVVVTYDGSTDIPVDAGSYAVVATIDDAIYEGSTVKAFTLSKASQSIAFDPIGQQTATATVNLSATGGASGNPVTFAVTAGPAQIDGGNQLSFTGSGAVSITASQAGGDNHFAAADVTRTFTVTKAEATVALDNLTPVYDGTPKTATATTDPAGLSVSITYNGSTTPPTAAGSYGVVATINDPVYGGSASGSFVIGKAAQAISFDPIGDQLATATVTLVATGGNSANPVIFEVTSGPAVLGAGNVLAFTGSGMVSVTATQAGDSNHLAATPVVQTFEVSKAPATVVLSDLSHVYDGAAKEAQVTTTPSGLTVDLTYDGGTSSPSAAGDYAVIATIVDAIYEGSASGTLTITKATQTISFASISDQVATATVTLSATGGASGNPVTFVVTAGPATLSAGNVLSFTGAGDVTVTASQAESDNYFAADPVSQTFTVTKDTASISLTNLSHVYDGTAKPATATTTPSDLNVELSYNGVSTEPLDAGDYAVVATIVDPLYAGTASAQLKVEKATQVISFPPIADQVFNTTLTLSATGGASGNPVVFAVTAGPAVITGGNLLSYTSAGTVSITASQAGGPNHEAAANVTQTFEVTYSGYDAWRAAEYPGESDPAIIGFSAAPGGQAIANGFRYYLGNEAYAPGVLTALGEEAGAWLFTYERVEPARTDVDAFYEWSTDLQNWKRGGESFDGVTVDFSTTVGAVGPENLAPVTVQAIPSGASIDRLFVRLKLVYPAP